MIKNILKAENIPYLILFTFACIYIIITSCNHYFFRSYGLDYGSYNFAFYDIAHFRLSDSGAYLLPHMNFLQDHVSFMPFLFIPLYWILTWATGTYTLFYIQLAFILYGGWGVFKLIELKMSEKFMPSFALLLYFILFGRWTSFLGDCNWAIFASSMIPVLLYYLERKKLTPTVLTLILILLTREDMALWTMFIGLFYLIFYFRDRKLRRFSIIIISSSIVYFVFVFEIIIPLLETPFKSFSLFEYSALGKSPIEAIQFILKNPIETFKLLFSNTTGDPAFDNVKFEFYYVYFLSGGFLLLYRPKYLLFFIPITAKKMLNDIPIRWSVEGYYSIEFVSILPVVVFLIISEVKNSSTKYILTGSVILIALTVTIIKLSGNNREMDWWGDSKYAFYKESMYSTDFDAKKVHNYLNAIPTDAEVSSSTTILPHLSFRKKAYHFPRVENAEYIAVFKDRDTYPLNMEQFNAEIDKYKASGNWEEIVNDPPLLILKKKN